MSALFDLSDMVQDMTPPEGTWRPPTFKECAAADIKAVFLDLDEFAERRTVRYDGETYPDVRVVFTGPTGTRRVTLTQSWSDHTQGLYKQELVAYFDVKDIGGRQPKRDAPFYIQDVEVEDFFHCYNIEESTMEGGMVRLGLGATQECSAQ